VAVRVRGHYGIVRGKKVYIKGHRRIVPGKYRIARIAKKAVV